jgi:type II secretion system protein H
VGLFGRISRGLRRPLSGGHRGPRTPVIGWPRGRVGEKRRGGFAGTSGFSLVELILVMLLLAIAASLVAPRMSSFFRGRALNFEARRMLSLTHYAQSRAVAEGVPVILWVNPRAGTYGVEVQTGHATDEDRVRSFTADPSLTLEAPTAGAAPASESDDERFGLPEGLPVIRFNPDGFFDEISVTRIVIQQGDDGALQLVQKENRLGYEIRPGTSD